MLKDESLLHAVSRVGESLRISGGTKKDTIKGGAILWIEIIDGHQFFDGNKKMASG